MYQRDKLILLIGMIVILLLTNVLKELPNKSALSEYLFHISNLIRFDANQYRTLFALDQHF